MQDNSISPFIKEILLSDNEPTWSASNGGAKRTRLSEFPPDKNIDLWLKHNAPVSFEQLADIRYALYHRCSRAEFKIAVSGGDQFSLTGRYSTLEVVNDDARHYLLWKLRLLGRKNNWVRALPKTKNPRR